MSTSKLQGFGFDAADSEHHFAVLIPRSSKQEVLIFELNAYDEELTPEGLAERFLGLEPLGKARLSHAKWSGMQAVIRTEFSRRLRSWGQRARPTWQVGINRVHRHIGKELTVLAWALEEVGTGKVEAATRNWLALRPEERWWLFTMTNAATGHPEHHKGVGWRRALRYALAEAPVSVEGLAEERGGGVLFGDGELNSVRDGGNRQNRSSET